MIHKNTCYLLLLFAATLFTSCHFYGPEYYQKGEHMYVRGNDFKFGKYDMLIEDSNPETFRIINEHYTLDSTNVYYLSINPLKVYKLEDALPSSFELLSNGFARDSVHGWWYETLLPNVKGNELRCLGDYYAGTDSIVFYRVNSYHHDGQIDVSLNIIPGADPESFLVHRYNYAEDKNDVYFNQEPLHVFDRETFTLVEKKNVLTHWAKDKQYVYYMGYHPQDSIIVRSPITDYDSFEVIDEDYARDKVNVYYHDVILQGADPASLEVLNFHYARDNNSVYCGDLRVCDYDRARFREYNSLYVTDGNTVFYCGRALPNADAESFTAFMSAEWGKDKHIAYFKDSIIEGSDPNTFELLNAGFSRDKNHVFMNRTIVEGADPKSFKVLYNHFEKDKYHVFYKGKIVEGADVATFEITGLRSGKDKNREYNME